MTMLSPDTSFSQDDDYDLLLYETLSYDSLLLDELAKDSLSILDLIDSLLFTDFRFSSLMFRASYVSDIMNAGRDFGVKQYGFSAGLSYYHKTGLFADITSYWNSNIEPHINPTTFTLGYMGTITPSWNYIASYDHFYYSKNELNDFASYPITNSLSISSYVDIKFLSIGVDYAFLFGTEQAHRIRPNIYGTIRIKEAGFIDEIDIYPSAGILLGNSTIYYLSENYQEVQSYIHNIGGWEQYQRFRRNYPNLANYTISSLITYDEEIKNVFGIMNYSFSIPVMIRKGYFTLSAGYYINFPVPLRGEEIDLNPNSYYNIACLYSIPFKSRKKK